MWFVEDFEEEEYIGLRETSVREEEVKKVGAFPGIQNKVRGWPLNVSSEYLWSGT